ncbi:DUF2157 domain-containing protein [Micavibrio aeruginosavorus]|uniref:DUF2157 domain-containing protein n=1 Tax=Micavibrio aeruginosavorus EPB TaxID=349215 RepID=M4VI75_9BACT|nr:DUF2157 domain-containing protein [Micavibrio aeruginosavorus]AGH99077.1 hypothetical protein A11S_2282 [Micavibrio aeruginosavorus EPB]
MFGVHRKIKAWEQAGLISADQAASITDFERNRQKGRFAGGLMGLSLFAILVGVLMVIGANWNDIPDAAKLLVHAILNIGAVVAVWRFHARGMDVWREGAVLVLAGLTLTFMALVGQIYHLNGGAGGLLALWLIVISPFMVIYGRTMLTAIPWVLAFLGAIPVIMDQYLGDLPDIWMLFYSVAVALWLPLAMCADGFTRLFRTFRPVWAFVVMRAGFILLTFTGTMATMLWYVDRARELGTIARDSGMDYGAAYMVAVGVPLIALVGLAVHYALYNTRVDDKAFYRATVGYCALCVVSVLLPFLIPSPDSSFMAGLTFIAFWIGAGFYGHLTGAMRLVSLAVTLIGLRIYVIFLEAFAGLMTTGFGLIIAGVAMLGMIWGLRRANRYVRSLSHHNGEQS